MEYSCRINYRISSKLYIYSCVSNFSSPDYYGQFVLVCYNIEYEESIAHLHNFMYPGSRKWKYSF